MRGLPKLPKGLPPLAPTDAVLNRHGYGVPREGALADALRAALMVAPKVNPNAPGASDDGSGRDFPVYRESATRLYLPRALGLSMFGVPGSDKTRDGAPAPGLTFAGELRPHQIEPTALFMEAAADLRRRGGLLVLSCAAGKTTMGLWLACQLRRKTLIVCHKAFLLEQWRERIAQFVPSARVGLVKQKRVDVADKDIVLASLQSLAMRDYGGAFEDIHMVIFDECHHLGAEVFSRALFQAAAPIRLGLSATPQRKDGLSKVFEWHLGAPVFVSQKREDTQLLVYPLRVYWRDPEYSAEPTLGRGKLNTARMINNVCAYAPRNALIVDTLAQVLATEPGRRVLVLSERRGHLVELEQMVSERGLGSTGFYVGGMKQADLDASATRDIILATFAMFAEGADVPALNTLVLASPVSSVEQPVGRIQRERPEARRYMPLVLDVVDGFSLFQGQARKRMAFYKKSGFTVEGEGNDDEEDAEEDAKKTVAGFDFLDD